MCDVLSPVDNGAIALTGTFVGATATYTCDTGYILEGNEVRLCQSSGQWTGSEPSCRSKETFIFQPFTLRIVSAYFNSICSSRLYIPTKPH